jgi:SNF2 family DNA or RNA helicase
MRQQSDMHVYQNHTVDHILEHPGCGVFLGMGLGKTISTLTAIKILMDDFAVCKTLIIGPKYVAFSTWPDEIKEWEHVNDLTYTLIEGTPQQRVNALKQQTDIHLINRELVAWLVTFLQGAWPYDMMVVDEISSFKNNDSQRFKALKQVRPLVKRLVALTGTPAGNGLIDLWAPMYLIDRGKRLGESITAFRHEYFTIGAMQGRAVLNYDLRKNAEEKIFEKISDICISMKAKDYLELPGCIEQTIHIDLPPDLLQRYEDFEEEQVLEFLESLEGEEITALNAAALIGKLLQFANGSIYDAEKKAHKIHDAKLEALGEIIEAAQGDPVLVFYQFQFDREAIMKKYKAVHFRGDKDKVKWNKGEIPVMCCHAASAGHGLNIQYGGHIMVWYGLPWSLELYQQANARLDRQGQTKVVLMYKLLVNETVDFRVLRSLNSKAAGQDRLLDAVDAVDVVKELIVKHTKQKSV